MRACVRACVRACGRACVRACVCVFMYLYIYVCHCAIQVNTFLRQCAAVAEATCNCAVAVKSGDDVIVIDRCGAKRGSRVDVPMTVTAYLNGKLTSGTKVYQYKGGDEYRVS